jgi:hypothetical protein
MPALARGTHRGEEDQMTRNRIRVYQSVFLVAIALACFLALGATAFAIPGDSIPNAVDLSPYLSSSLTSALLQQPSGAGQGNFYYKIPLSPGQKLTADFAPGTGVVNLQGFLLAGSNWPGVEPTPLPGGGSRLTFTATSNGIYNIWVGASSQTGTFTVTPRITTANVITPAKAAFSNPIGYDLKSLLTTRFTTNVNQTGVTAVLRVLTPNQNRAGYVQLYSGPVGPSNTDVVLKNWNGLNTNGKRLWAANYAWTLTLSKPGMPTTTVKGNLLISNVTFVVSGMASGLWDTYQRYMIPGTANLYISATGLQVKLAGPAGSGYNQPAVWNGDSGTAYLRGSQALKVKGMYTYSMSSLQHRQYYMTVVQ